MKTLAHKLMRSGHRVDHDGCDLYVKATPRARAILINSAASVQFFTDNGEIWARIKNPAETRVVDRLLRDIRDPSP